MLMAKCAASRLALSAWVAIAIPAASQSGPSGSNPGKRLGAWEKQLVLPTKVSARLSWADRRLQPTGLRKLERMGRTLAPAVAAGNDFDSLRAQAEREIAASFAGLSHMDISEAALIVLSMAIKDMDDDIRMIMAEIKATNAAKQKLREMIKELNGWISREMSKHPGSEDIDNEKVAGSKTKARAARPTAKATAPPLRRITLDTKTSPVIHLEYVKAPTVPPLPPRNPGLTVSGLKSMLDDLKGKLDSMNEMSEMTSLRLQMTMDRRSKIIQTLSNIIKKIGTTQETIVQNIK
jgi:Spy/CpxP family protein refolding chaperone